jgi:hypothetical protein
MTNIHFVRIHMFFLGTELSTPPWPFRSVASPALTLHRTYLALADVGQVALPFLVPRLTLRLPCVAGRRHSSRQCPSSAAIGKDTPALSRSHSAMPAPTHEFLLYFLCASSSQCLAISNCCVRRDFLNTLEENVGSTRQTRSRSCTVAMSRHRQGGWCGGIWTRPGSTATQTTFLPDLVRCGGIWPDFGEFGRNRANTVDYVWIRAGMAMAIVCLSSGELEKLLPESGV